MEEKRKQKANRFTNPNLGCCTSEEKRMSKKVVAIVLVVVALLFVVSYTTELTQESER